MITRMEGIIPALEAAHAVAHVSKIAPTLDPGNLMVVSLSGRGDKDLDTIAALGGGKG